MDAPREGRKPKPRLEIIERLEATAAGASSNLKSLRSAFTTPLKLFDRTRLPWFGSLIGEVATSTEEYDGRRCLPVWRW